MFREMKHTQQKGSEIAKSGFQNEDDIIQKFNNWKLDITAKEWLSSMGYEIKKIEKVIALKIPTGYKSDVQIQVSIFLKDVIDTQNIQVKLVSNKNGFNQIDRRWISKCEEQWNIPIQIATILRYFTGENLPYLNNSKSKKRMFMTEFSIKEQNIVLEWIKDNKMLIVSDLLKGRGKFAAEWMLVTQKTQINAKWVLKSMNYCLNFFGNGNVVITPKGSFQIGRIGVQRKGGDGGRPSANQLQFKINPALLFETDNV